MSNTRVTVSEEQYRITVSGAASRVVVSDETNRVTVTNFGGNAFRLRGRTVGDAAPSNDQVLAWVAGDSEWAPADVEDLLTGAFPSGITTDTVDELTAGVGVTVDGLLIQDGSIPEAAVTEHEAALSIDASQVANLGEGIDDQVAALIQDGTGISWAYDDGLGTLTPTVTLAPFDTDDLAEGANLYWTQARFDAAFGAKTTDDLSEGSALYYTDERVDDRVAALVQDAASGGLTWAYSDPGGTLTPTLEVADADVAAGADVAVAKLAAGAARQVLQTDGAGTGVEWTDDLDLPGTLVAAGVALSSHATRHEKGGGDAISLGTWDTGDLPEGANLYWTQARFDAAFGAKDTGDLSEGANLYYTDERVDDRVNVLLQDGTGISWAYDDGLGTLTPTVTLAPFDTDDLAEGSALYYTDERVDDRVAVLLTEGTDIGLTYDDGAGTLTIAYTGGAGATTLAALDDVTITGVADGELLAYENASGDWINRTLAEAGVAAAGHVHAAGDVTSGTFADARIAESNVTQHEGALSIGVGQLTGTLGATSGGTGQSSVAAGDLLYGSAVDTWSRLAKGSDGEVLTLSGGLPAWGSAPADALGDLSDVVITSVGDNELLAYDNTSGEWINQTPAEAGVAAASHVHAAGDVTSGTFADARIAESNVTQHEGALSITASQVTDFQEAVEDDVATLIQDGTGISWSYSDPGGTLTPTVTLAPFDTGDLSEGANLYYTDERVDDRVAALVVGGTNVSATYADPAGTLTLDVSPQGAGSGLNADTVDGSHASAFATAGHSHALDDLSDVVITSVGDGELLAFENASGDWINRTLAEAGVAAAGHVHAAGDVTSGTFADARIAESNVTQHESAISHDALSGFVANEHVDHSSVSITAGTGLSGGGDLTATRNLALSHLGLESLADPNADRIFFWDDGGGAAGWLAPGTGLSISTTTLNVSLGAFDTDDLAEGSALYYTDERVDDRVAVLIQDGTGISWAYDDGLGTLTPTVTLAPFDTDDLAEGGNLYYTDERVDDRVNALLTEGTNITLTYDDGAGTLEIAAAGGGTWELVSSQSASDDATVEFTSGIDGTYEEYLFVFHNVVPATDNVTFQIRTSTDGGVSWDNGANDYDWNINHGGRNSTSEIQLCSQVGSDTNENGVSGTLTLIRPAVAHQCHMRATATYISNAGSYDMEDVAMWGQRRAVADVDGVQFYFSSGNVESGEFYLYGLKTS